MTLADKFNNKLNFPSAKWIRYATAKDQRIAHKY